MTGGKNFLVSQQSANKIIYEFMEPERFLNIIQKFDLYLTENKLCIDFKEQLVNGNNSSLFIESYESHAVCGKKLLF
jgi:hypothetical protein